MNFYIWLGTGVRTEDSPKSKVVPASKIRQYWSDQQSRRQKAKWGNKSRSIVINNGIVEMLKILRRRVRYVDRSIAW